MGSRLPEGRPHVSQLSEAEDEKTTAIPKTSCLKTVRSSFSFLVVERYSRQNRGDTNGILSFWCSPATLSIAGNDVRRLLNETMASSAWRSSANATGLEISASRLRHGRPRVKAGSPGEASDAFADGRPGNERRRRTCSTKGTIQCCTTSIEVQRAWRCWMVGAPERLAVRAATVRPTLRLHAALCR